MIRAIIFDCFGVLYRDNQDMLYDMVSPQDYAALQDIIRACDYGFISRQEYFEKIAELAGKTVDDIRDVDKHQYTRNEPLVEKLRLLKRDYKIGLLSNIGNETMDRLFSNDEREELFDDFVLSSEVGMVKPAVELFELAAEQLGLSPDECVMIDDLLKNVDGAERAGMTGVLFSNNRQLQQDLRRILGKKDA